MDADNVVSADAALQRLIAGNERFQRGEPRFSILQTQIRAELVRGQHPYATILGCSDSRVPPEVIFDAGPGELFVVRVAGNVVSPEVSGSLQYAGSHLHTLLFVVLGHEDCGAVKAALETKLHNVKQRSQIQILVDDIMPALTELDMRLTPDEQLGNAIEANVRWTMRQLAETPGAKERLAEGQTKLVGGIYEIASGRVRFI
ncbi:MAG TPA: carbonic anhydrase [Candidatus Acidoferrales bacterium]|nr:carbonic anhydrase [Candidatus Acidoferrales bacterium]